MTRNYSRRSFASQILRAGMAVLSAPAVVRASESAPAVWIGKGPGVSHGVASGDVSYDSAIIWSRSDRPGRMIVDWSTTETFSNGRQVVGPVTNVKEDFTAKLLLTRLPPGQRVFYRVYFEDRSGKKTSGQPEYGEFVTAPRDSRDILFAWSGDTCGQGYGIDELRGGMRTYAGMRKVRADLFIHSGDTIYADGELKAERKLPDGSIWKNLLTPEKSKVAETLAEFRGNYRYNLLDANVCAFNSDVALFAQWDDHEVRNNWYPGQILDDAKYTIKDVNTIARNARQAFFEYLPLRPNWRGRIFRSIPRGPLCEIFMLDLRTYRGPNTPNRQTKRSRDTVFFGDAQLGWIKQALRASKAVWKIIASDMPIGLVVGDGKNFENFANSNGPALGRELEVADLLQFIQRERIHNTMWLTADVHYAASNYYNPQKAQFPHFNAFWEFVSGPLHAASLAPGTLDNTFGPEMRFSSRPKGAKESGPYSKEQFFSTVGINGRSKVATVTHYNRDAEKLWSIDLEPVL